ncbi:LCP family protein [Carboxydochorda subterranea]|uniref:LCP family protein n=1 Tax=Carboxydichorda subterranea TaxID=3109565 RepID=A0ABZ1BZI5_9FIRM|nr:LCP family protein [Limnochorda sp. L945t]WRP18234.1 LCP family protein [Limnochorda sp. L945t]
MIDRPDLYLSHDLRTRQARPGRRRRRLWWLLGAGFLSLVVSVLVTFFRGPGWLAGMVESPLRSGLASDGYLSAVVVGTDDRAHDPGRTDTIMVVSFSLRDGKLGIVSIPRDTRVRLPGGSYNKVNMVFTAYGPRTLMRTLSDLLGVPVDGYVRVDFQTFEHVIDTLGGVEVDVPRRMHYVDRAQGLVIDLQPGRQRLNGKQALEFVRYRADGLGDISYDPGTGQYYGRIERQQQFIRALASTVLQPRTLARLPRLVRQAYGMVETDLSMDLALAASSWLMRHRRLQIETSVLPGMPGTVAGASYWLPDRDRARQVASEVLQPPGAELGPVAVLNANGVGGSAARVAQLLEARGIRVARVENAKRFGLDTTRVVVLDPAAGDLADRIATLLSSRGPEQEGPLVRPWLGSRPAEPVVVLVGRDLAERPVVDRPGLPAGGERAGSRDTRTAGRPRG